MPGTPYTAQESPVDMASVEGIPWLVDFAPYFPGLTPPGPYALSNPQATLYDVTAQADASGRLGAITLAGTGVRCPVSGLLGGHSYRLLATATMAGGVFAVELVINVHD